MGRKKKEHQLKQDEFEGFNEDYDPMDDPDEIEEEKGFFEYAKLEGWNIPYFFENWERYYATRASFIREAIKWAEVKMANPAAMPTIQCDTSKGLRSYHVKKHGVASTFSNKPQHRQNRMGYAHSQRETGDLSQGYSAYAGYQGAYTRALPLDPKIPAPEGKTEANLVVM